ncbi:hypothetical protein JCM9957A_01490 [Kineosporia succinea]
MPDAEKLTPESGDRGTFGSRKSVVSDTRRSAPGPGRGRAGAGPGPGDVRAVGAHERHPVPKVAPCVLAAARAVGGSGGCPARRPRSRSILRPSFVPCPPGAWRACGS